MKYSEQKNSWEFFGRYAIIMVTGNSEGGYNYEYVGGDCFHASGAAGIRIANDP